MPFCRELEKAIKDKVLVEPKIPTVIRDLQSSGCWVFGVTARYHEMAVSTDKCLKSLGINFAPSSPFPPQFLRDPQTGAVCVNGIIYCNGLSKGNVLKRFFENVVLRNVLTKKKQNQHTTSPISCSNTKSNSPSNKQNRLEATSSSSTSTSTSSSSSSSIAGLPDRFIFIDDQRSQAECISKDLTCARTLSIPITCYHYTPEILRDPCEKMDRRQRGIILLKQMMYFIETKMVLSNKEALLLCKNGATTTTTFTSGSCGQQSLSNSNTGITRYSSSSDVSESSKSPSTSFLTTGSTSSTSCLGGSLPRDSTSISTTNNVCKTTIRKQT